MRLLPFHWHFVELAVIVAAAVLQRLFVSDRRQRRYALIALAALAAVTMWPIGDLAATVSLTVATVQRLVIMLAVAPLLLLATPTSVFSRLTRPAPVDAVTRRLAHPGVALVAVTVFGTYTLTPAVIDWGAHGQFNRDVVTLSVLALGVILWTPALALMPGTKRLSPIARAGYVFVSALVVTSLSFVWIFSRHPLYPALHHQHALLHMTPLFDQELAGFVAKLGCYAPMWTVAFLIFSHAEDRGVEVEQTPLHWADVERELLRLDRQRARDLRHQRSP
ncbi:MAG: cytochrome c oxidase assembly protein [Acidimicrobiales bacterium]